MEVLSRQREMREVRDGLEDPDGAARAGMLSDALLRVYCVLRNVPDEEFGGEVPERERYAHMGALMVAQEAANAEMERLLGKEE